MTEAERERNAYEAYLRAKIAAGEMTPEEAESEWDYHVNGWPTRQNVSGL